MESGALQNYLFPKYNSVFFQNIWFQTGIKNKVNELLIIYYNTNLQMINNTLNPPPKLTQH